MAADGVDGLASSQQQWQLRSAQAGDQRRPTVLSLNKLGEEVRALVEGREGALTTFRLFVVVYITAGPVPPVIR